MVDVIIPEQDEKGSWQIDALVIVCTLTFAVASLIGAVFEKYLVLFVAMILCIIFAYMFMVLHGTGKK